MKVQIASDVAAKMNSSSSGSALRRYSSRAVVPSALLAAVLLPLLFIRTAFLAIEAGASISCLRWSWIREGDPSMELRAEWRKTGFDEIEMDRAMVDSAPDSLEELVAVLHSISADDKLDMTTFVLKVKTMILKMEHKARSARLRSSFYRHLASVSFPKSFYCLSLLLAEEYSINSLARSSLPESHHVSCLTDTSYLHIALLTDNILAASVVISSTIKHSKNPNNLVFHIITDKKTFSAMHAWFAVHQVHPAVVEVKGLHQFDLSAAHGRSVVETIKEVRLSKSIYNRYGGADREVRWLESLKPSAYSLLNYLKIHLPEFFPKLEKVILLEDDVVVHCDLAEFYKLDLGDNVIGSVVDTNCNKDNTTLCIDPDKRLDSYLNFSNPIIVKTLGSEKEKCAWSWGVNIFNLWAWRQSNITELYQFWLRKNRESGFILWPIGSLSPALIAFHGFIHPVESSWLVSDLGWNEPDPDILQSNAVLHFNGPAKPWLEIGYPATRELWQGYLNRTDEFLPTCGVIE